MNAVKYLGLVGLAAAGLFAGQAATACPTAPATGDQTMGSPVCIAPVGTDGGGTGLVNILAGSNDPSDINSHSIFSSGPGINPYNDQTSPSTFWAINGTGGSENTVLLTLTANKSTMSFGIFDPTDPSNRLMLFDGNTPGFQTTLAGNGHGLFKATYGTGVNNTSPTPGSATASFGDGNLFGYYLTVPKNNVTFYSEVKLNSDGIPHMATYAGNGQNTIALTNGAFSPSEFLLAWEDTPLKNSDLDYNDFIVAVESVHAVPEPAVLGMFGLGLLVIGAAVALRRRGVQAA